MGHFVYILVSETDGTLYTGQTSNMIDRLERHNKGLIKSTKAKAPYTLGYFERLPSRSAAMWREWELKKKWSTARKKRLVESFDQSALKTLGL